MLRKLHL